MNEPLVLREHASGVTTLTFNRPAKLNALNHEITEELIAALRAAQTDAQTRVIVLRGSGRGFSAGQDLEAFVRLKTSATPISVADHLRRGYNVVATLIRTIEKPVIASLNGIAAGVGLSIALVCDLRVAADDAELTLGFSKIGLIPDGGGSFMLPLLAGFGRALELAWSSEKIVASEALRLGLVNRVVPAERLVEETQAYAARFARMSPIALALTKRAFNRAVLPNFEAWLEEEALLQEEAASGPDLAEGVRAFLEKRAPAFSAR
jgi:2-(1,2-epoxy-1,2-dihydrophenyl)acetyl-CoA isomerase